MSDRVAEHVRRFGAAVTPGEWASFVDVGAPTGPFAGREAILAAYESHPPVTSLTIALD